MLDFIKVRNIAPGNPRERTVVRLKQNDGFPCLRKCGRLETVVAAYDDHPIGATNLIDIPYVAGYVGAFQVVSVTGKSPWGAARRPDQMTVGNSFSRRCRDFRYFFEGVGLS